MIQHTDNKPQQQRLVCLDTVHGLPTQKDGSCKHPFMMINDVGKTFGTTSMFNADKQERSEFRGVVRHADLEGQECVRRPAVEVVYRVARASEDQRRRPEVPLRPARSADGSAAARPFRGRALRANAIRRRQSTTGCGCSSRSATRSRNARCTEPSSLTGE